MMFPSFHRASVLGAGLDREERDIHHLLAMMMCLLTDKDLNNPMLSTTKGTKIVEIVPISLARKKEDLRSWDSRNS